MANVLTIIPRSFDRYLASDSTIDWQTSSVMIKAMALATNLTSKEAIAEACFIFVRDEVDHSWDYQRGPVTCKASDVLFHKTGFCYAKSHLLAALLRANDIPAGLCYQRLTIGDNQPPFCLHSLNAIHLEPYGWYRVDARGNKDTISAGFSPPQEKLAFPITVEGEVDFDGVFSSPLPIIIHALETHGDFRNLAVNLPDLAQINLKTG